ncbi:methyltransferase type 11 [Intrasporangium oryzae NRRL B-24470]|uniref:Methyltransferase type 11 n=1 Tax=Intrasporangium oryzae NRRL B-24470 TaxID=1386089 RepID=W9G5K9_9MICO|nr:class I SAM-dependent methyltransferase [Intrasporangium oryzae]EWT01320.1 methyltransferase type 11 [Intrasporangium oryzae NRRL B-24470]
MAHDHPQHSDARDHAHDHAHDGTHPDHDAGLADLLDLDAEVLGAYLDEVTAWAAQHAPDDPRRVVDLGAGTGTGTRALGRRFAAARLVAVDRSEAMAQRLRIAADEPGLAGRVEVVLADLDGVWPKVGAVDVAWAASSLHELADPDRVLRDVHAALRPGGLLVVVEMDTLPRFLPDDLGTGRPGLETRLHDALARAGWNAHPDWQPALEQAGFEVAARRTFTLDASPAPARAGRYARAYLSRVRGALDGQLAADDRDTLDRLLAHDGPDSLLRRRDLVVSGTRTAWAARRPLPVSAAPVSAAPVSPESTSAPDDPFSAAMEAFVTMRVLGDSRHGLDSLLDAPGEPAAGP